MGFDKLMLLMKVPKERNASLASEISQRPVIRDAHGIVRFPSSINERDNSATGFRRDAFGESSAKDSGWQGSDPDHVELFCRGRAVPVVATHFDIVRI